MKRFNTTILFDLDGTLIDSTEAILDGFNVAFNSFNCCKKPDNSEILKLIGYPLDIMFKGLGVPEDKVDDYVKAYKSHYRVISREKTFLLENALDAIKLASTFANLGIVTTKTAEYSKILLEHFNVMQYFEVLIGRENVENPKPHREPIDTALKNMNLENNKTVWMIGDTCLDILSAKNANINSVAVLSGYALKENLEECTSLIKDNSLLAVKYINKLVIKL